MSVVGVSLQLGRKLQAEGEVSHLRNDCGSSVDFFGEDEIPGYLLLEVERGLLDDLRSAGIRYP